MVLPLSAPLQRWALTATTTAAVTMTATGSIFARGNIRIDIDASEDQDGACAAVLNCFLADLQGANSPAARGEASGPIRFI
jgi:hypothetical protein